MFAAAVVEIIESKSGWGQRPDGFIGFANEADANAFITQKRAEKQPYDLYMIFNYVGLRECSADFNATVTKNGLYVDKVHELMWPQELRDQKYTT